MYYQNSLIMPRVNYRFIGAVANRHIEGLFRNPGLLGIIVGLIEREHMRGTIAFLADLTTIFPMLTAELGMLSALDHQFCEVISLTDLGRFTRPYEWCGNECTPCGRI